MGICCGTKILLGSALISTSLTKMSEDEFMAQDQAQLSLIRIMAQVSCMLALLIVLKVILWEMKFIVHFHFCVKQEEEVALAFFVA